MNNQNLNLKKYDRVFAFGCSFTNYRWATWADIIAEEINPKPVYNYGMGGGGNLYIAHSVSEADVLYKFNERDLIMIMWTNVQREDRFYEDKWIPAGNIYSQAFYPPEWKYLFDETHFLLRDLSLINFVKNYLENKKIDHHMMSMVPIGNDVHGGDIVANLHKEILNKYNLSFIKPSIWETIFNCEWHSIQPRSMTRSENACHPIRGEGWYEDNHAHPKEYLEYLKQMWPETRFKKTTEDFVNFHHTAVLEDQDKKNLIERRPVVRLHEITSKGD